MDSTSLIFYTYIYLNPRKPGNYSYGDYTFDYEPFYVGKGMKGQWLTHLKQAENRQSDKYSDNPYKLRKIRKLLRIGFAPIILKIEKNLLEQYAYDLETWFVWAIGRHDLKLGPLTNLNDGGLGSFDPAKIVRMKKSLSMKGKLSGDKNPAKRPEVRNRISEALKGEGNPMYGKRWTDDEKEKFSLCKLGEKNSFYRKTHTQETKDKISKSMKGRVPWNKGIPRTDKEKEKISKTAKEKKHKIRND